jgi:hypothetical protein
LQTAGRAGSPARHAPAVSSFNAKNPPSLCYPGADEKPQLIKRLPAPLVRHLLHSFRTGQICTRAASDELGLSRSRFYELYAAYLHACAHGQSHTWSPGLSGGDHHPEWSAEVTALITKLLSTKPPCSYSAVASELLRRLHFKTDRASVRRWATENQLAPDTRYNAPPKPTKRWQARDYGALWQYDATPHAWLPNCSDKQVLLNILDDATRLNTGARRYPTESLLAHFDFLSRVFQSHGLPLSLYVDYHPSFTRTTPTLSPNWAKPSAFTASNSSTPPRPKPKSRFHTAPDGRG